MSKYFLVAYDIRDAKRIVKVARLMKDYGRRVQKSIFELELTDKSFKELNKKLKNIIEADTDGVRFYELCGKCIGGVEVFGVNANLHKFDNYKIL